MDNEITITLVGSKAYDYIRNESAIESAAAATLEENSNLHLKVLELEAELESLKSGIPSYLMKDTPSVRVQRDSELMKDSQYEKKSPFKRPVKPEPIVEPTLDDRWREFVDAGEPAINSPKTNWSETDSAVVKNAINKTDIKYYSVEVLSKFLSRSIPAVRSRAIKTYGAHIRKGMIVSET